MECLIMGLCAGAFSAPGNIRLTRYAVGLYRVSTPEQGQSCLGLEAQRASVRAYVATQGWTLVAEHEDVASGKDDNRSGFQADLAACRVWICLSRDSLGMGQAASRRR